MPQTYPAASLLFDLDGTLIDTIPDLAAAVDGTLARLNRAAAGPDHVRLWIGNGMDNLLIRALRHADDGDEPADDLLDQARTHFKAIYGANYAVDSCLYDGVAQTLEQLASAGIAMGIVTNKPEQFVAPLLAHVGIERFFSAIVGGDTVSPRKPDPAPLYYALEQMKRSREDVVFVGDSVSDITAARRAGFPVICLSYGYNHGRDIRDDDPDAVIDSLAELPALLDPVPGEQP